MKSTVHKLDSRLYDLGVKEPSQTVHFSSEVLQCKTDSIQWTSPQGYSFGKGFGQSTYVNQDYFNIDSLTHITPKIHYIYKLRRYVLRHPLEISIQYQPSDEVFVAQIPNTQIYSLDDTVNEVISSINELIEELLFDDDPASLSEPLLLVRNILYRWLIHDK